MHCEVSLKRKLVAVLLLTVGVAAAQQQFEQSVGRFSTPASSDTQRPKITAADRERAAQLLEAAEGQARGMKDPGSRAFALLQLGRAYKEIDKKKAIESFEEALSATRAIEDDPRFRRSRARIVEQILDQLIPLAPEKIDDFLAAVDSTGREKVFNSLLRYHNNRKQTEKALETIYRMGQEFEIPYGAAGTIMSNLTPEQSDEMQQLFTTCIASYRDHEHEGMFFGGGDFGSLVAQYYRQVPAVLARQAIDVLLSEARKRAKEESEKGQPTSISMSSAKGAIALSSYYDYRLFQLLPALKALDPQEAEKLLKERQDVQTLLAKYPEGMSSVAPELGQGERGAGGGRRQTGGASFMVGSGGPGGAGGGRPAGGPPPGPNPLEMQKMAKLIEDADEHPQDSIANAGTLTSPEMKVQAYLGIARETWKKNSSAARAALGKANESVGKLDPEQQLTSLRDLAGLYESLGDKDESKKVIEKGIASAEKMLKTDTNAEDPNQAPKAYWPSTGAYRSMLALAAKISPTWAVSLLKEIPDEDIKAINQIAIANSLLQTRGGMLEVMQFTKSSGRMMVAMEDSAAR